MALKLNKNMVGVFVCAAVLMPAGAYAQIADSGAFYVRLGTDTIAIERYVRTPHSLVSEAVLRTPQTRSVKLTVTFKDDGTVSWYELVNSPVAGVPNPAPQLRSVVTYLGDSADVQTFVNAVPRSPRKIAAKPDMLPVLPPHYSTYEGVLMKARKAATDTLTVTTLVAGGPLPYLISYFGSDSVTIFHPQSGAMRARVDERGRLLGLSGEATTFKVQVTRARWVDLEQLARRFAADDAAGKALGALSPRDSLEVDVGDALVLISYGRPSKRGRVVFGGVVPWDQVWRTGANQATSLTLTEAVEINGVKVPAGRYTLWTVPRQQQWLLIINKQIGQWGTIYDEKQDLVRIPVAIETVAVPVETFTIDAARKSETEAVLRLTWDKVRVLVPLRFVKAQ